MPRHAAQEAVAAGRSSSDASAAGGGPQPGLAWHVWMQLVSIGFEPNELLHRLLPPLGLALLLAPLRDGPLPEPLCCGCFQERGLEGGALRSLLGRAHRTRRSRAFCAGQSLAGRADVREPDVVAQEYEALRRQRKRVVGGRDAVPS